MTTVPLRVPSTAARSKPVPPSKESLPPQVLQAEGGVVRAGVVAKRLGVPAPVVDQLRAGGRLLAVPDTHGYVYPAWQFEGRGLLSGLHAVMHALEARGPAAQLTFLLTAQPELDGQRPLDLLRQGGVDAVLRAIRTDTTPR